MRIAPLEILIVDDEPLARDFVRGVLETMPALDIVGECADGVQAIAAIRKTAPDLVLLDVQMPELGGFDVIEAIGPAAMPAVIFVTAYERHTLRAFEVHALDYVLKPFDPERLRAAVEHARARIVRGHGAELGSRLEAVLGQLEAHPGRGAAYARLLTVQVGEHLRFVSLDDVDWIEAERNHVRLHVGGETHLLRTTLKALLRRLDPSRYIRIHRSAVVNVDRVREVQPWFGGDYIALLNDGQKLRVSRTYRAALLDLTH